MLVVSDQAAVVRIKMINGFLASGGVLLPLKLRSSYPGAVVAIGKIFFPDV